MNILFITSESQPFIKIGSYNDCVYNLAKELALTNNVSVFLPCYKNILKYEIKNSKYEGLYNVNYKNYYFLTPIYSKVIDNIKFYFILNDTLFNRTNIYGYEDDNFRFNFISKAITTFILMNDMKYDIAHVHDYPCAIICKYLKDSNINIKTIFTLYKINTKLIRNIENNESEFNSKYLFNSDVLLDYDSVNTVSNGFKNEILNNEYFKVLKNLKKPIVSINLAVSNEYNPSDDYYLTRNYSINNLENKVRNKLDLQKELNFEVSKDIPLYMIDNKLNLESGIYMFLEVLEKFLENNVQLIIMGSANKDIDTYLKSIEDKYRKKLYFHFGYDEELLHRTYGSSDMIIHTPFIDSISRNILIALRYGVIPIVRSVGSVKDICDISNSYCFNEFDKDELYNALLLSINDFNNKKDIINYKINNGFSYIKTYEQVSKEYIDYYNSILDN